MNPSESGNNIQEVSPLRQKTSPNVTRFDPDTLRLIGTVAESVTAIGKPIAEEREDELFLNEREVAWDSEGETDITTVSEVPWRNIPERKGLGINAIKQILSDMATGSTKNNNVRRADAQTQDTYRAFTLLHDQIAEERGRPQPKAHLVEKRKEYFARQDIFQSSIEEIVKTYDSLSPLERRVISSDLITLYGLLVDGHVNTLVEQYIQEAKKKGESLPQTSEEWIQVGAELIYQFKQRLQDRNREKAITLKGGPTVGLELEYHPGKKLVREFFDEEEGKYGQTVRKLKPRYKKSINIPVVDEDGYHWTAGPDEGQTLEETHERKMAKRLRFYSPVVFTLSEAGGFKDIVDGDWREVITNYSHSFETQLRMIAQVALANGIEGSWNFHQTLGGVDLTPEHTEIMDIRAISTAAGFIPYPELQKNAIKKIQQGKRINRERHDKPSAVETEEGMKLYYFPYHKRRFGESSHLQGGETIGVERRSFPHYHRGEFVQLVHEQLFSYLSGWAIQAVQKPKEQRTPRDIELASAWTDLMGKWNALLSTQDERLSPDEQVKRDEQLRNPKNEERWSPYNWEGQNEDNRYGYFLDRLRLESQQNSQFKRQSEILARTFMRQVKDIIGY